MLSEHEDNPCYRVAHNWTFLEKQVWVWILRDIKGRPSHKYRNAGDRFECNRSFSVFGGSSQKIRGLTLISPPALCHSWWFCSGSVSAGRGMIPSTTLLDYKTKKKKARWLMFVCVISGVTSSDMDASTSNTLQAGASIDWKIYCGSWLFLFLSLFFDILPFLVLNNSAISVSQGNKQETKYWKVEQEKLSVPLSEPGVLGDSTEDTGRV